MRLYTHPIRLCIVNILCMWTLTPRNPHALYVTLHSPYTTVYCEYCYIYSYVDAHSTQLKLTLFDFTPTLYDCVLWISLYILICEVWLHTTHTNCIRLYTHPVRLCIVNIAIYTHMWTLTPCDSHSLYLTWHSPYTTQDCVNNKHNTKSYRVSVKSNRVSASRMEWVFTYEYI